MPAEAAADHTPLEVAGNSKWKFLNALTIFVSALLLFQVEPLIAKLILPWFGGVAAVWMVCLLFFQLVLLLGYLYAHLLSRHIAPRTQGWLHAGLLAASLLVLPILPKDSLKPPGPEHPALHILWVLALTVGFPFFLLSATSPLLQAWLLSTRKESGVYRFSALSNAGSLLGLLSYPTLVEPRLSTVAQPGWGNLTGPGASRRSLGWHGLCPLALVGRASFLADDRALLCGPVRVLHVLSWRVGAVEARSRRAHVILFSEFARKCSRRGVRGHPRSANLLGILRIARRPGVLRLAGHSGSSPRPSKPVSPGWLAAGLVGHDRSGGRAER